MMDGIAAFPEIVLDNGFHYYSDMNDKQLLFHECTDKFRWMGGGVGGGKSVAALVEALRHSWYYLNRSSMELQVYKVLCDKTLHSLFTDFSCKFPTYSVEYANKI